MTGSLDMTRTSGHFYISGVTHSIIIIYSHLGIANIVYSISPTSVLSLSSLLQTKLLVSLPVSLNSMSFFFYSNR